VCEIFESKGADVYLVELEADIDERLKRNTHPHRLENKPTKRNIQWSEYELIETMKTHRLNSNKDEIIKGNYIKINNTNLSAVEVAKMISLSFNL